MGLREKAEMEKITLREADLEVEEANVSRVPSKVYSPSPDEYNRHCATHMPYRSWCPICVQAKKRNPAHRSKNEKNEYKHVPVISMDYMYLNEKNDDVNNPILVIHDSVSEGIWAVFVKRKGDSSYSVKRVSDIIKRLGYSKIIIKSDQESSLTSMENKTREALWQDAEDMMNEIKQECGGIQIVIQHSLVGESAANGAVENAIQRVEGQIRAIRLDVEVNSNVKINPSHAIWPWLVEFAAQSILYWRVSGHDGLTAIERIRGRSSMSAKPRFGENVLYKVSKTVKLGKAEPRWRPGVWLGSIENSDEHLLGTDLGVIKARAITSMNEERRFDGKAIESMKGIPWKPSTRHRGIKIRTHLSEKEDEGDEDEEGEELDEVPEEVYDDEDPPEVVEEIAKQQEIIYSRFGHSYNFTIKARDVIKYGATEGCPGCRFVIGELSAQCGHSKECKARMMKAMEADRDDKHRVKQWYSSKGVDQNKEDDKPKDGAEAEQMTIDEDDKDQGNDNKRKAQDESEGAKRRRQAEREAEAKRKQEGGEEREAKVARNKDIGGASSSSTAVAVPLNKKPRISNLTPTLSCLNFTRPDMKRVRSETQIREVFVKENPLFTVVDATIPAEIKQAIKHQQHKNMKYFIDVAEGTITTNSVVVMSMLIAEGVVQSVLNNSDGFPTGKIPANTRDKAVEGAVNRGMVAQLKADAMQMFVCAVTGRNVEQDEVAEAQESAEKCHGVDVPVDLEFAWDDVNDCELNIDMVKSARAAEMEYFHKMKVYRKVPIQKCRDETGRMPIKVRWIDTNKQDEKNPRYRSRLVAKEFKRYNNPDLFTGTPPIEMLRFLVSTAATGWSRMGKRRKIMVNDVARAYFNAPNLVPTFVDICEEDREPGDEGMCGELLVSMYGTRPAANNWQKFYTKVLLDNGFKRSRGCTCTFHHSERDIDLVVHGDDFITTGDGADLQWLKTVFESKFEISTNVIGHEPGDEKQLKVLNRIITVEADGYTYEPDARHAEIVIREMNLQNSKAVTTPVSDEQHESDELLDHERFKKYQSLCARCNFLAIDRMDIQFASKECCRAMSSPTLRDWAKLKRLGRYLLGKPRLVYAYHFQEDVNILTAYSDANWASQAGDRRSTSGGVILHGGHYIKSWSRTQSLVALSSAEAELYGIVKCSSELLGFKSIIQDLDKSLGAILYSDASAALGVVQRQGLGRLRHIDCSYLFVQALNANKVVQFAKVWGQENPSDIGTKGLSADAISRHISVVNGEFREGRPEICPGVRVLLRPNLKEVGPRGGA